MSGVILAVPDRPECASDVLAAGENLARLVRTKRINVLVMRMPPEATIFVSEEVLTRAEAARRRAAEQGRADQIKKSFLGWSANLASRSGLVAEWCDIEGKPAALVDEWGRRSDFIVMGRPISRWLQPDHPALHTALFATDRPVLIAPPLASAQFGHRIAIAWRDDGRTLRAVLSVLRWAGDAEEIHVLTGVRDVAAPLSPPQILEEHGITATLHVLPITASEAFGEALLTKAHAIGADMLVMGAFVRSPVRNLILGGVTRHMLAHADLPVLMRH
jgi:nucleotide-binding universal stress UspA family protein